MSSRRQSIDPVPILNHVHKVAGLDFDQQAAAVGTVSSIIFSLMCIFSS